MACFLSVNAEEISSSEYFGQDIQREAEVSFRSEGELSFIYNQGVVSSPHSYSNITAQTSGEFSYENGWSFGLGAIGGFNVFNASSNRSAVNYGNLRYFGIGDLGDISKAFVRYKNLRLEFKAGRFNNDFVDFPYITGDIQGASVKAKIEDIEYFGIFMDSLLLQNNHANIAHALYSSNVLRAYYPYSKREVLGFFGELFAGGATLNRENYKLQGFGLINTQLPVNELKGRQGALLQAGVNLEVKKIDQEIQNLQTLTLRSILQAGNTSANEGDKISFKDGLSALLWVEYKLNYNIFELGGGAFGVVGSRINGGIYTFTDPSYFYGKVINAPMQFPSPYFLSKSASAYGFGSIDFSTDKNLPMKLHGTISFGSYNEVSILLDYTAFEDKRLHLNLGAGYVYSHVLSIKDEDNPFNSSLLFFSRFYY